MGVTKQPDGTWHAHYCKRHPLTRKPVSARRKNLKSEAAARKVEKELVLQVEEKLKAVVIPKWGTLYDEYVAACRLKSMTEKTIHCISVGLKAATFDSWSNRFIDSIVTDEIRTLILTKYKDHSPSHQKTILKYIRCAFAYAVDKGYLARNPTPQMAFRIGDKIKKVLTEPQVRELLNKAKVLGWHWYYHYALAVYTGMRNGELYALTWDKVDLAKRQIVVDCAWNNKAGFKSTKSGDDRILEIAPSLVTVLQELKLKTGSSRFVLPRLKEWDAGRQCEKLREFQLGAGLPQTRFHDLRATWCTLMLGRGIEPIKVMKMGGWKDVKTMMHYIRQAGVDIKGITDTLDLHDPVQRSANVINLDFGSNS